MQCRFMQDFLHVVSDWQHQSHLQCCQKGELFGPTPDVQNLKLWERHPVICVPKSFQVLLMLQQLENHSSVPLHILLASGCLVAVTSWGQPFLVGSDKPAHLKPDSDFLPTSILLLMPPVLGLTLVSQRHRKSVGFLSMPAHRQSESLREFSASLRIHFWTNEGQKLGNIFFSVPPSGQTLLR